MFSSLPPNTVEWYFAITSTASKTNTASIGLAGQLLKFLDPAMGVAATALTSIITPSGNGVSDIYLIATQDDLNRFLSK